MSENKREQWSGRLGFILASAGSAVGLGNVWRFPYLVGMNGGAAFVLVYIALAISVGISVMLAEFCLGRGTRLNAVGAFRKLSSSPVWRICGWFGVLSGGFFILSYYGVIAGWTLRYTIHSITDLIPLAAAGESKTVFGSFLNDTASVVGYQIAAMAVTIAIVAGGVSRGIERACKFLMPMLFLMIIVLIVRSVSLPGALEGVKFYLMPDFSKITAGSLLAALGQGFYSLSIGMGILVTYASYIPDDQDLASSGLFVLGVDTAIALLAGLVIFPAVFAMGVAPDSGPGLTFITLPGVFAHMPGGEIFSFIFFLLLFFAAITSMMSLLEVAVSFLVDEFSMKRHAAAIAGGGAITLFGVLSAHSLADGSPLSNILGMTFFDLMDSVTNNIMMPISAMGISLFVGWLWADSARRQITNDGMLRFPAMSVWMLSIRFFAPTMIAIILVTGWPF